MAIMSFVLILAGIHKSKLCDSYRDNPELNKRIPNYRVSLGFGLHIGWAIEGAIGSTFKIDASYLSPNVNMANILEAATKEYGTPLLFTGDLANHFSDKLKTQIRLIDSVKMGTHASYEIYTIDLNLNVIMIENLET